jgi:peptidoglycan/LPS O-acetylase OafA/YrhL
LALMLTVGFSAISYRYLEKPFLRLKLRFTHVSSRPGG